MPTQLNVGRKAAILALRFKGNYSILQLTEVFQISERSVRRIIREAVQRGYDPALEPLKIEDGYLESKPRSGRPSKVKNPEIQEQIIKKASADSHGREKSTADIAGDLCEQGLPISASTVSRVLKSLGYRRTKPARKPTATKVIKATP